MTSIWRSTNLRFGFFWGKFSHFQRPSCPHMERLSLVISCSIDLNLKKLKATLREHNSYMSEKCERGRQNPSTAKSISVRCRSSLCVDLSSHSLSYNWARANDMSGEFTHNAQTNTLPFLLPRLSASPQQPQCLKKTPLPHRLVR